MSSPADNPYGRHASHRRRAPRSLTGALARMRGGATPPTLLAAVQEHWQDAVGGEIAGQATPTSERGGVVTISCASSVWAGELEMMAAGLLERLNDRLPQGPRATDLRFVTRPR